MTIPDTIPFSELLLKDRARSKYEKIPELANSIYEFGLLVPLIIASKREGFYRVLAGGRRYKALELLGTETLYHAHTCYPSRPGFILNPEASSTVFGQLVTELTENLYRDDPDWRDVAKLITKVYYSALQDPDRCTQSESELAASFGATLGVPYANVKAAIAISDELATHPENFAGCDSMRTAYARLLQIQKKHLISMLGESTATIVNNLVDKPKLESSPVVSLAEVGFDLPDDDSEGAIEVVLGREPEQASVGEEEKTIHLEGGKVLSRVPTLSGTGQRPIEPRVVDLRRAFQNVDGVAYMEIAPPACVNHIITDPDYAISVERLSVNSASASDGVAQKTVEQSLAELHTLITHAHRMLDDKGFLIFFLDMEHWNTLLNHATDIGFKVQRWPLIWKKTDFRSNAAPQFNFCKNTEYAMVCRMPGATLNCAQMSSVIDLPVGNTAKQFGHPFAKPIALWQWLMRAVAVKTQVVFDPCVGSGSMPVAALDLGLNCVGCEIKPEHYNQLLLNLKAAYKVKFGDRVKCI